MSALYEARPAMNQRDTPIIEIGDTYQNYG